jgi:acetyl-CoA carboxylase biotin carboxyl carrier protein
MPRPRRSLLFNPKREKVEEYGMGLMDKEVIIQLLKIVSDSTLDEVHLESGDLKFIAKRHAPMAPIARTESAPGPSVKEPVMQKLPELPKEPKTDTPPAAPSFKPAHKEEVIPEGSTAIRSPMLGTFYRAPKPDAPPFVEVGRFVTEEDAVCIIEVMKLFNTVKAGVRGRIAKICSENAQLVEYKQVLFLVEETTEDAAGKGLAS